MKKFTLAIVVVLFACFSTYAQHSKNVTAEDAKAAIAKGNISKPTPPVVRFLETDPLLSSFPPEVTESLVWYKYKGVFYSALYGGPKILIVVFTPNGEYANGPVPADNFFML